MRSHPGKWATFHLHKEEKQNKNYTCGDSYLPRLHEVGFSKGKPMGGAPVGLNFVSHLYISLAAYTWLAPLQNSFLQKKVVLISFSDGPEGKHKWQKEWRKGTWMSGQGVKLWGSSALSSPRAALDTHKISSSHDATDRTSQKKGLGLYAPEITERNSPTCI